MRMDVDDLIRELPREEGRHSYNDELPEEHEEILYGD